MQDIILLIKSINLEIVLSVLKYIFIGFSLLFFLGILFFISRATWLKRRLLEDLVEIITYRPFGVKKTFKRWVGIAKRLEINSEAEYKLAIIEADALLNDVLEKMGYKGGAMEERLKEVTPAILPNLDQVLEAHKIRNNVVHEPDYSLSLEQAKKTVAIYEESLRSLEAF